MEIDFFSFRSSGGALSCIVRENRFSEVIWRPSRNILSVPGRRPRQHPRAGGGGDPGTPSGRDAVSSSTNWSHKADELAPKLNPLAGSAFIKPPEITNYGSVGLSYPIEVPPGRNGIQPGVGLSYSSSGGDGLVGIGWSLGTGLGVISRTTQNGQLYYDHRDIFTYNGKTARKGERCHPVSENGTYRLEIESGFSRFELTDAGSGGVWRMYDKSGTMTLFGEDISSRIYQPANNLKTYIWNFSRTYDLNGNFMEAIYDTSEYGTNHVLYVKEIRYTGNSHENMPATAVRKVSLQGARARPMCPRRRGSS